MLKQKFFLSTLLIIFASSAIFAQILINEVFISGFNGSEDNDHGFKIDDWFELYNAGSTSVDLTGYYLSDNQSEPKKYQIPTGTINAGGFLVFKANGLDNGSETNFKLDQGDFKEEIVVTDPAGNLVDIYKIRKRTNVNHSRGRVTDGSLDWGIFTNATEGSSNNGQVSYPSYADSPTPSPTAGFYTSSVVVTIPVPTGYVVRYTLDSTDPTTSSALYSSPIVINQTSVLKIKLFDLSGVEYESFVKTNTYFIDETHELYVLSVTGKSNILDLVNGDISLYPIGVFEWFDETGERVSTTAGNLNKHGQDSWVYPQRGFDIFVRDETGYGGEMEHKFFEQKERESFDRFIMRAAGDDNYPYEDGGAHIRDAFVQEWGNLSGLEMDHRTYRPCIVYLNGNYWGVYEIREKVVHKSFTSHYYNQDEDDLDYISYWGGATQRYGTRVDWDNVINFIKNNDMSIQANFDFVDSEINLLSMTDYALYNNYIVSKDWNNYNTAWWRGRNPDGGAQKWQYILWDMDASFGHYINYSGVPDITPQASPCDVLDNSPISDPEDHLEVFEKLIDENSDFNDFVANRYNDLLNTYWDCSYSIPLLNSMIEEKEPEMQRHINRWWSASQGGNNAGNNNGTYAQWEDHVQDIRDFLTARCNYIDGGLSNCLNLGNKYQITFETSPADALAKIKTNTITLPQTPLTGDYYDNLPLQVAAESSYFYEFSHWTTQNGTVIDNLNSETINVTVNQNDVLTAHYNTLLNKNVVINEIHYNPADSAIAGDTISGTNFEFIELKNIGTVDVDLQGVQFEKGISFQFENSYIIPVGGFVVLADDSTWFHNKYGFAPDFVYSGKLDNGGENIWLTDQCGHIIDSLKYLDVAPWDDLADNGINSLALIDALSDNADASNWSIQNVAVTPKAENTFCDIDLNSVYTTQNISCFNYNDGFINASISGGTQPYNYTWSNGNNTNTIVNLPAGEYILSVIDQDGCRKIDSITLTEPVAPTVIETITHETSTSANDGSINISVAGASAPYSYNWSNGSITNSIANLAPGNYSVDITDANNCVVTITYEILTFGCPNLNVIITSTDETANAANDGTANVNVNDINFAPYNYLWSNGVTTNSVTNLNPGNYTVTITGANGCIKTENVNIAEFVCADADADNICDVDDICINDPFNLCYNVTPCISSGDNTNFEYIDITYINDIANGSGDDNGYGDFTNLTTTVVQNGTYNITIVPEFLQSVYDEYYTVWIDFDKSGTFDSNEIVYSDFTNSTSTGTFTINPISLLGNTIMRVKMDFTNSTSDDPCGTYTYGETEDYGIFIVADCGSDTDYDNDGICDLVDVCASYNDAIDSDNDGIPDGCDTCPNDNLNDADNDGVCANLDICPGFDDNLDLNNNGIPDGCDAINPSCVTSLILNTNPESTGIYQADDWIESTSKVNISSGGPVNYNAGDNYIELNSGFDADGTVNFIAEIIDCDLSN